MDYAVGWLRCCHKEYTGHMYLTDLFTVHKRQAAYIQGN